MKKQQCSEEHNRIQSHYKVLDKMSSLKTENNKHAQKQKSVAVTKEIKVITGS